MNQGLEKLTSELRHERQKATEALQDRARLKVENESQRQQIARQERDLESMSSNLQQSLSELSVLRLDVENFRTKELQMRSSESEQMHSLHESEEQRIRFENENALLKTRNEELEAAVFRLNEDKKGIESKYNSTKTQLLSIESEVEELRTSKILSEEQHLHNTNDLRKKIGMLEEMKDRVKKVEALELSNQQLLEANEQLQQELEESLTKNVNLSHMQRMQSLGEEEKSLAESALKDRLNHLRSERDELQTECDALKRANSILQDRMEAEQESSNLLSIRSDNVQKNYDLMESKVASMDRNLEEYSAQNKSLEDQLAKTKVDIAQMNNELITARSKAGYVDDLLKQLKEEKEKAGSEEEYKKKYLDLRRSLAAQDMDRNATNISVDDSVAHRTKEIYENIVIDLRQEVSNLSDKNNELTLALKESMEKNSYVTALEEELHVMKDTAQMIATEKKNAALTASQAVDRSMKVLHDRETLLRDLSRAEDDLVAHKREIDSLKDQLRKEKTLSKDMYNEKLQVERSVAERIAAQSRLEVELEAKKETAIMSAIDLDRMKRKISELTHANDLLKLQISQRAGQGGSASSLQRYNEEKAKSIALIKEDAEKDRLTVENGQYKKMVEQLNCEIGNLKSSVKIQRQGFDNALHECNRLHKKNEELRLVLAKHDAQSTANDEEKKLSDTVAGLQDELNSTMQKWMASDSKQSHKTELIQQLQGELKAEKEVGETLMSKLPPPKGDAGDLYYSTTTAAAAANKVAMRKSNTSRADRDMLLQSLDKSRDAFYHNSPVYSKYASQYQQDEQANNQMYLSHVSTAHMSAVKSIDPVPVMTEELYSGNKLSIFDIEGTGGESVATPKHDEKSESYVTGIRPVQPKEVPHYSSPFEEDKDIIKSFHDRDMAASRHKNEVSRRRAEKEKYREKLYRKKAMSSIANHNYPVKIGFGLRAKATVESQRRQDY